MTNDNTATADNFTEAARAESEERYEFVSDMSCFEEGAEWARDYLAAQEPTDSEMLAAREAVREVWRKQNGLDLGHVGLMEAYAHAALSAARKA